MSETIYVLVGYPQYEFVNKICYRKEYITSSKTYKYQYRNRRKINISNKGKKGFEQKGYWLIRNGKRSFTPLTKLHHRLKKTQ